MKTATVRDLRNNFSKIETWVKEGEDVRIDKRGEPVAVVSAFSAPKHQPVKWPDFQARRKAIWGDRVFSAVEVAEMRAWEQEHEGV